MDYLEPMSTWGIHDTGRRQAKHKNTTQHRKLKDERHGPTRTGGEKDVNEIS